MQICQLVAGVHDSVADMPLLRLHVIDIAIDVADGRVTYLGQVAFGICNGVHQAHFSGADRLDGGLDAMFCKQVAAHCERLCGALKLDIVIRFGSAHGAGHDKQILAADRLVNGTSRSR